MALTINETDADLEAQIIETRRLIASASDSERRAVLEEHLRELELAVNQAENQPALEVATPDMRRKSFRPTSAKPRMTLTSLTEDQEIHLPSTSFKELDAHRADLKGGLPVVTEVLSSSYDEEFAPNNVIMNDHRSFWLSSGMFPQFLRLQLREPMLLSSVEVTYRHVKKMHVRTSAGRSQSLQQRSAPVSIEIPLAEAEKLSTHHFAIDTTQDRVEVVEIGIESSYCDFAVVYYVRVRRKESSVAAGSLAEEYKT